MADSAPWLDAPSLWGRAFERTLDALGARLVRIADGVLDTFIAESAEGAGVTKTA
ncbi:hypothetical protein [Streptomyces asiaticus]|nr:hypothetical protein [Streptomyces asiaticus]